jgi:hypothetical protein
MKFTQFDCGCTFTGVGEVPDNSTCRPHPYLTSEGYGKHIHPDPNRFSCDECDPKLKTYCDNYRPSRELRHEKDWPVCVCGHVAQAHNGVD